MSALLPLAGLAVGVAAGYFVFGVVHIPPQYSEYVSLATLAGLDTVLGGIRAGIEGRFQDDIFVTGFLINTVLAVGLAWFGDLIGVSLFLAGVVALGTRVFLNLSLIRRYYLTKAAMKRRSDLDT